MTARITQLNVILTAGGGKFTLSLARLGLPFRLPALDIHSKIVGRTGVEPVTSSVSGNSGVSGTVGLGSNGESLIRADILATSQWVWRQLTALAPVSGSRHAVETSGGRWRGAPRDPPCRASF